MVGSSKLALLYEGGCKTGSATSCGDTVVFLSVEHWVIMLQGWGVTSRLIISSTCCKKHCCIITTRTLADCFVVFRMPMDTVVSRQRNT